MNLRYERKKPEQPVPEFSQQTKLIWHPLQVQTYYDKPINSYCHFRKVISLKKVPKVAVVRTFADTRYVLFVNGTVVARGPMRSDPRWQYYDEFSIAEFLQEGDNVICALVLHYGYGSGQSMHRIPAFFLECAMMYSEAKEEVWGTDQSWKVMISEAYQSGAPRLNGCKGPVEIMDNQRFPHGWLEANYDDSQWSSAQERERTMSPFWNLKKRPVPMQVEGVNNAKSIIAAGVGTEAKGYGLDQLHWQLKQEVQQLELNHVYVLDTKCEIKPVDRGAFSYLLIDFDQVDVGYLNLNVTGYAGDIIDVIYAEELLDGKPEINGISYRPISRFILKDGENQLSIQFDYEAFRYVMLIFRNHVRANQLNEVKLITKRYPMERESTFQCDDERLNKLWDISVHTLKLCMQDAFLDSPSREQQQWMGDGRFQAIINHYISGDTRMHAKLLLQIAQSQDLEGMTCSRYPDENFNLPPIASYCLQWICSFGDYYDAAGDLELIQQVWNSIIAGIRWFSAFENESGLLEHVPYWQYFDCGKDAEGRGANYDTYDVVSFLNMLYAEALDTVVHLAAAVGDLETERFMKIKSKRLKKEIKNQLWNKELGAYADGMKDGVLTNRLSEAVNALAILNLHDASDSRTGQIIRNVFDPETRQDVVFVSPYFMVIYARAMAKAGKNHIALNEFLKRYRQMLDTGATSTWEDWDRYYIQDGKVQLYSACHGWGAAAVVLVAENILGIDMYHKKGLKATPNILDFQFLDAKIETPRGTFEIKIEDGCIVKNTVKQ